MPTIVEPDGTTNCNPCNMGNHLGCRPSWTTGMRSKSVTHDCECAKQDHTRGRAEAIGSMEVTARAVCPVLPEVSTIAKCVTTIPKHLRHLSRDKRGFPVPHVSEWSDESVEANDRRAEAGLESRRFSKTVVGKSQHKITVMDPAGQQGVGSPKLASLHPGRQRDCVLNRRCQVCGHIIAPTTTVWFVGGEYATDPATGKQVLVFREPPLHKRCATFALFACPGINTGTGLVVECREYKVLPFSKRLLTSEPVEDGSWPTETVYEFLPAGQGYLEYLLAAPGTDAKVHVNLVAFREIHAGMVK